MPAKTPEHIRASLIAGRIDTFQRSFQRLRAAETDPDICEKWDTLCTLTGESIGLYHDRIPVVPNAVPHSTGKFMIPGEQTLTHALLKKD